MIQVMAMYRPWISPTLINKLRAAYGAKFYDLTEVESTEQFRVCLRSASISAKAILTVNTALTRRIMKEEGFEYLLVYPFINTEFEKVPSKDSYMTRQVYDCRNEAGAYHQEIRNRNHMVIEYDHQGWVVEEVA